MGFTAWAENSSPTDQGFDAVMINEDPVMGGSILIEAKKLKNPVSVQYIRALAGAVDSERATKGFLVTNSRFTTSARDFAARSGRIQLIDGRALQSLLSQHLGVEADL
jgi:restriction system protein